MFFYRAIDDTKGWKTDSIIMKPTRRKDHSFSMEIWRTVVVYVRLGPLERFNTDHEENKEITIAKESLTN